MSHSKCSDEKLSGTQDIHAARKDIFHSPFYKERHLESKGTKGCFGNKGQAADLSRRVFADEVDEGDMLLWDVVCDGKLKIVTPFDIGI